MLQIPLYGLTNTGLESLQWLPTELLINLARINRIPDIMSSAISHECNQLFEVCYSFRPVFYQVIQSVTDSSHNIDVLLLIESTDIVGFTNLTFSQHEVERTRMVIDIQPVSDLTTIAIHWQQLVITTGNLNVRRHALTKWSDEALLAE